MKILAIRLKNLTSIEGTVEVDFTSEPLRSAGIFAISGPTGAGKSTLLDALCLALYDKAPRFASSVENISLADVGDNQINQADVRNLLRRGTSDGYSEVDFLGIDGHRYRSRWSVRRTRNKVSGSLQAQVMQVSDLDTAKEFQGTKRELLNQLTELVGLNYEQFTRTVLLAQNDFATFLKSKGAAKAELLEKLTGTAVYSRISQEIYSRSKTLQAEVDLIRGKMNAIELMSEEDFLVLQKEKEEWMRQREAGGRRLAVLNEQWQVVRSLQAQEELLVRKQQEEQQEKEQSVELAQLLARQEEDWTHFKQQCEDIQPDLQKARALDVQIQSRQADYGQAQLRWKEAAAQVAEQEKKLRAAYEASRTSYESLVRLLKWPAADEALSMEQVTDFLRWDEADLKDKEQANEVRRQQLEAFAYPSLVEEQGRCREEKKRLQTIAQLTKDEAATVAECQRLGKEVAACGQRLAEQRATLETVKRVYDNARMAVGKDVKALRSQLQEGEACPVCGSVQHPYASLHEGIDTLFRQLEQEFISANETYQQTNNQFITLQRDWVHHQQEEQRLRALLQALWVENVQQGGLSQPTSEAASEVGQPDSGLTEHIYCRMEVIDSRLQELSRLLQAYQRLYEDWQRADVAVKQQRMRCEQLRMYASRYQLEVQKLSAGEDQRVLLQQALSKEQTRFSEVDQALHALWKERGVLLRGKSVEDAERAMKRKEEELTAELERVRKAVEMLRQRQAGLQGEIKQIVSVVEELREKTRSISLPLLSSSSAEVLSDVVSLEEMPLDAVVKQLSAATAQQEADNRHSEQRLSAIEVQLLQQQKNKEMMIQVTRELEGKQRVAEQWAKLNKLLGSADGAKFKVIAQSYTLNHLLRHANRHLSYLTKRYKLQQVPGTLALQVIDCDMCDEVRTVYSLSGGESFLISLALALGLSSLSSNNLKVESLFIDEGFGSLDADSLRTAMEALEQLQMQGRKVGVISHVQEMSERISVQIQVHKKINGKSVLTVVG
ncbi:ATP-dependent exonuclease SbcC [gut metagenome]|uniref:ATP-dependent exonuclease SbcC n=1 Tax=gut metagenome TaxID=749906 RepID=J9GBM4_9ZZZZ